MPDDSNDKPSDMEASIRERIAERESELWLGSRLLAGTIGAAILCLFAYFRDITFLGAHPLLVASAIGFVIGVFIGERIIFTAIGILLAYLFLPGLCG